MHVVDGDLLKAACNQRPVLHIQHFIEQHHQQIIQKFFLLHASSPPHRFSPAFQYTIFRILVQRPIRIRIPEDPVLFFAHTASQTCRNHIRNCFILYFIISFFTALDNCFLHTVDIFCTERLWIPCPILGRPSDSAEQTVRRHVFFFCAQLLI